MFKIFRNIRKQLLSQNKTIQYLKYAIGEIILVMVGILLALQINNWNEQRKKKKSLQNIYRIIADDLRSDSTEVDTALGFMNDRKEIFERILNDSLTADFIRNDKIIGDILTDIRIINIEKRGYNLLKSFENSSATKKDSLAFQIINFYNSSIFYTEKVENLILDDLIKTNDLWKRNSWYANLMLDNADENFITYMLTNQEFENLCAFRYSLYYQNYQPTIEQFQSGSERILASINERLIND